METAETGGLDGVWLAERHFAAPGEPLDAFGAGIPSIASAPPRPGQCDCGPYHPGAYRPRRQCVTPGPSHPSGRRLAMSATVTWSSALQMTSCPMTATECQNRTCAPRWSLCYLAQGDPSRTRLRALSGCWHGFCSREKQDCIVAGISEDPGQGRRGHARSRDYGDRHRGGGSE